MRRLQLLVLPFLAAFALVFGLFYLYTAFQLVQQGYAIRAALFGFVWLGAIPGAMWRLATRRGHVRYDKMAHAGSDPAGDPAVSGG